MTGVTPLYRAKKPSSRTSSTNTLRMPRGYLPSGAAPATVSVLLMT